MSIPSYAFIVFLGSIWRRQWHRTPALLPGKSHGWRSLVGCSPWRRKELDTTERLHFHFSLSCTGKGNGNPLQRSCLVNPRDGGAWWAPISGLAQSQTRLKWLSSSSSSRQHLNVYDPLKKEMATCSSILAWEISRTETGKLQYMGLQIVRHDLVTEHVYTYVYFKPLYEFYFQCVTMP